MAAVLHLNGRSALQLALRAHIFQNTPHSDGGGAAMQGNDESLPKGIVYLGRSLCSD